MAVARKNMHAKKVFGMRNKDGKLNKKGIFFTFIAIGLVSLVVYSFVIHIGYIYRDSMFVIETRVNTISSFIKDVEVDINRGFYISSFRALLAIQSNIASNQSFIPDVEAAFEEALFNSTVRNESNHLIVNASFTDWVEKIQEEADKIDLAVNITAQNVTLNQSGPWTINAEMDILINITDKKKTAYWVRHKHITTHLDIEGFEDPVYSQSTYGKVTTSIKQANSTNFNDLDVLKEHISNSYYIESERAPSFLMRMEGNLSNSSMGIESIVNYNKLLVQGITPKTTSMVDYIYFANGTVSSCKINETNNESNHDWFRLDDTDNYHLNKYDVTCN